MITGWSPVATDLYGYQPKEIIGRDATVLLPAGWESEEADLLRRAGAGERIAPYTTNRVRNDGTIITVLLGMSAMLDETGAIVGVASTSRLLPAGATSPADVQVPPEDRERLRAQLEQAQRLEGLGQLAGGVAHDFNNLIAVILNCAAFVGEEIDTAAIGSASPQWKAAAEDIGQIRRAAERAAGLTRQLLSFARREVIQPQVVDLSDLLTNMASILRRTLGADLNLVTNLAENLPPVLVDPGQIDQVILNLAVNARDAMPDGGSLTITTDSQVVDRAYAAEWSSVLPGNYIRITVTDTGKGMPPNVIKHAFEPFYTTKSKGEGSGLGLATVYGAVTQAEGQPVAWASMCTAPSAAAQRAISQASAAAPASSRRHGPGPPVTSAATVCRAPRRRGRPVRSPGPSAPGPADDRCAAVAAVRGDLRTRRGRAADVLAFELAARLTAELDAIDWITCPQRVARPDPHDCDVAGWADGILVRFQMRAGRLRTWTQRACTQAHARRHLSSTPAEWADFADRNAHLAAQLAPEPR